MYKEALGDQTLEEVIEDIQLDPSYVQYEDLPQNYINAVIATVNELLAGLRTAGILTT